MTVSTLKTGEPPVWVEGAALEDKPAVKSDRETGGQVFTLIDTEVNVAKSERFVHVIKDITTQAGVQSGANLEFAWDPSYQELTLHQITVQRGEERMDRLDPSKFKIIQQESDLNRQIYNGALSAVLFLEDVRVGDRIDYAYTLRGENPSFKGRYADTFILGAGVPLLHQHIRLLWPQERSLKYRLHGTAVEPEVSAHGGIKEYAWNLRDLPAVVVEDQVPSWFQAYPSIQLSEFTNWSEVASWTAELYVTTNLAAPALNREIVNLQRPGASEEQVVQGALEFVQNDIRYLGIEFGPHSCHPTDPVTVLQRRFGDCKDKAFLLCTLLRGLGYEATPVLVATGLRHTLPDFLPAPYDFDHVIVRVVAGGATYWLDPTRTYQRGPITHRYLPDYSFGLLVKPGEMELTPIPFSGAGTPETRTTEVFHVGGQKDPTQLSVTSTYNGFDAEWMRAVLASGGNERMAKAYLNDYGQRYPGVRSSAPLTIEDSTNSDSFTLTHTYTITNFWALSADKQHYTCEFYPLGIHSWITKPMTTVRLMPMELSFPRRRSVQTRIELPREFKLTDFTNTIGGPAAKLRLERSYRGQTECLDYEYTALTNFVPVSLTAAYLDSLDRMENALGYSLKWQSMGGVGSTSQFNWPIFQLAALYTVMVSAGTGFVCRHQSRTFTPVAEPPLVDQKLIGLGGWLIFVGTALVLAPLRELNGINKSVGSFALWKWHSLTDFGGVSYQPAWGPLLTLELLGQLTILILTMVALVLFFQRRRIFPRWYITLLVFNALFVLGDMVGLQVLKISPSAATHDFSNQLPQVFVAGAVWIPYMYLSRRVKATFVR